MIEKKIKNVAVFTSGGDAPGMNAAIRAVVRTGLYYNLKVFGIRRGYEGMIEGDIVEMTSNSVSNTIQNGGTVLKTARSNAFRTPEGRAKAYEEIQKHHIDSLVAIGGDGTFRGAAQFFKEHNIPTIGIPGTIDNDLFGTDLTVGFDTAINTAMSAIDKIRDTADAHNRLFFVEVMGRDAGFIALYCGLGSGAEAVLVPETKTSIDELIHKLESGWARKKTSSIVVVAEGEEAGGAFEIARLVKERFNEYDTRVSVLGHMQRGGSPSCRDRVMASRMGVGAVEGLMEGHKNEMIGIVKNELVFTPFEKATKHHGDLDMKLVRMVDILSS